ncbi:hypothetical protein AB0D14_21580 [Streptomyces sp. NPDC048484]|uniref:hypothetical protein n=1 Tax=Streptomyces sp. NPDC048484 TaxID=3155146 RepID=UPI00341E3F7C
MAATTDTPTDLSYLPFRPRSIRPRPAALSCFAQVAETSGHDAAEPLALLLRGGPAKLLDPGPGESEGQSNWY